MTHLLLKLFVKNYTDVRNPRVRTHYGLLAGIVGIVCNIFLFIAKLTIGLLFNAIAITADAINNLSDAGSSIMTLIGFKIASKPADEDHPFGHARVEYISGLIVAFLILNIGIQLIQSSIQKILHPETTGFSLAMVIVLVLSILMKLWMARFNTKLGDQINSTTLKATAMDSMSDVISTSAVLVSIIITKITGWQLDGFMGLLVAIFIIYSGINIIKETISPLLGEAPTTELVTQVESKILDYDGVLGLHDLMIHNYGPERCFASVHVEVDASEDILKSHDLIDQIERDFLEELGIHLVIHLDPIVTDDTLINDLRALVQLKVQEIDPTLSIHDFRVVQGVTHTNLIFDVTLTHQCQFSHKELAYQIDQTIKAIDPTYYTVITIDHNYISTTINSQKSS
ncbi:MAG: cation diffusion facilitator family transporter [Cellulosilyticaceae bacterium]